MIGPAVAAAAMLAGVGDLSAHGDLARYNDLPRDVRVFMVRRLDCAHWLGEDAYDRDRARQINRAVRDLGCARLDRDEATLRRRNAGKPRVLEALDAVRD